MESKKLFRDIKENIQIVITKSSGLGAFLWQELIAAHPADIAYLITDIDRYFAEQLFDTLPLQVKLEVFQELSDSMKSILLASMSEQERVDALHTLDVDELTDLFDNLSDEDLKKYLKLLHKREREKVLSLMQFESESAGGIMDINVITLIDDFTVEKSVNLLQRLQPERDIHQQLYVTDPQHKLVGHINLEDLVLHAPKARISSFLRKNELVVQADQDQEGIARSMLHYGLMTVPVVSEDNHFLGVISSETLVDIIQQEASEDVQKMSAIAPMKYPYFEMPFFQMLVQRAAILLSLLLAESISGSILRSYEATLSKFLLFFVPMLVNAGGGASGQTSALVIQGVASGEIRPSNIKKFLQREFLMAIMLSLILGAITFMRIALRQEGQDRLYETFAISASLTAIVFISVILGGCIPLILKRFNIDPAFSAGPFLATLMDLLGILVFCYITKLVVFPSL